MVTLAGLILVWDPAPAAPPTGSSWREAGAHLALFTSERAHPGAYRTYVSPLELDDALREIQSEPGLLQPPGAWIPRALPPLDAFGQDGSFDRWRVARLYGARRARVARGPRDDPDGVRESWTLVSPYPDHTQRRLEPGTLLIVLRLP